MTGTLPGMGSTHYRKFLDNQSTACCGPESFTHYSVHRLADEAAMNVSPRRENLGRNSDGSWAEA